MTMTEEAKQLLLRDLCSRLPYGVIIDSKEYNEANYRKHYLLRLISIKVGLESVVCVEVNDYPDPKCHQFKIADCKPYLRPLSNMTEDEFKELKNTTGLNYDQLELVSWPDGSSTLEFYLEEVPQYCVINVFNWLNKKHFDYNGLITMGLALEAPEGMYKID